MTITLTRRKLLAVAIPGVFLVGCLLGRSSAPVRYAHPAQVVYQTAFQQPPKPAPRAEEPPAVEPITPVGEAPPPPAPPPGGGGFNIMPGGPPRVTFAAPPRAGWEYATDDVPPEAKLLGVLSKRGQDGWELTAAVGQKLVFKRHSGVRVGVAATTIAPAAPSAGMSGPAKPNPVKPAGQAEVEVARVQLALELLQLAAEAKATEAKPEPVTGKTATTPRVIKLADKGLLVHFKPTELVPLLEVIVGKVPEKLGGPARFVPLDAAGIVVVFGCGEGELTTLNEALTQLGKQLGQPVK